MSGLIDFENFMRTSLETTLQRSVMRQNLSPEDWASILDSVLYPISAGGKRVRPQLLFLLAKACGAPDFHPSLLCCAGAIEFVHTYSLVHDDLPCMDDDDFRRGRPTTHKVFGDANALLVGDALLTHAFHFMSEAARAGLSASAALCCVEILSRCAGVFGMIGGQWKDLASTNQNKRADWPTLCGIHTLKTGALLGAACAMGTVVGLSLQGKMNIENESAHGQIENIIQRAEELGRTIGLAFQITDDILDATQNSVELGKTAGKDAAQNKLTAIKILGIEKAQEEAHTLTQQALNQLEILKASLNLLEKSDPQDSYPSAAWKNVSAFVHQLLFRTS